MKQALHIFAKDARHFWPEIALSVAVTALFAWISPFAWKAQTGPFTPQLEILRPLASLLTILVPVGWWLLITRAVQGESLVGDRQWWITKPYEWPQLLGGKLLFVAVFVAAPFLIAQCVVLEEAGFRWHESLAGLGFDLFLVAATLLLPMVGLAAVTSSFARITLTVLGILIVVIVSIAILASAGGSSGFSPYDDRVSFPSFILLCAAAVVLQYARRRVWRSRLLLVSAPLLLVALSMAFSVQALVAKVYPRAGLGAAGALHVAIDTKGHASPPFPIRSDRLAVAVPLVVSGVGEGYGVQLDGVRATIVASDGRSWSTSWQHASGTFNGGEPSHASIPMEVDRKFFDAERSRPVTLRLNLATTLLRAGTDVRVTIQDRDFPVPGVGICAPVRGQADDPGNVESIVCRSPMRSPRLTGVVVRWDETSCQTGQEEGPGGGAETTMIGNLSDEPAEFGIAPVSVTPIWLGSMNGAESSTDGTVRKYRRVLCPGTLVHFIPYTRMRRAEVDVTLPNYQLPDLKGVGAVGGTIGLRVF